MMKIQTLLWIAALTVCNNTHSVQSHTQHTHTRLNISSVVVGCKHSLASRLGCFLYTGGYEDILTLHWFVCIYFRVLP